MSEKVLLTKEQAEAVELWLEDFRNKDALIRLHAENQFSKHLPGKPEWKDRFSALDEISLAGMAKALYIGYEIEEPMSQFESGDLVFIWGSHVATLDKCSTKLGRRVWSLKEYSGAMIREDSLIRATQDQIYWLHELKRDCVNDFKLGDVVKHKDGDLCEVVDMYTGMVEDTYWCTVSDAIRWAEAGGIEYIYPVESRKPYRKGKS